MAISFDKALGIHPSALLHRSERAELLASNIANADTPHYKAKDIDFASALNQAKSDLNRQSLARTHQSHFSFESEMRFADAKYRVPSQPDTGDGNSVDIQVERNLYVENSMQYQASLQFLGGKFSGLKKALGSGSR